MKGLTHHIIRGRQRICAMLVLVIIGGFIIQTAVAHWMSHRMFAKQSENETQLHMGEYFGPERSVAWLLNYSTYKGAISAWSTVQERDRVGHSWLVVFEGSVNELPRWLRRTLIESVSPDQEYVPRQPFGSFVHVTACGWPFLSIWGMESGSVPLDGIWAVHDAAWQTSGAFFIEREGERHLVPYRPLVLGTVVNTIFFAVLITTPFAAAFGGRRLLRFERGRCPRCAYDLRRDYQSGCPECGWGRAHQTRAETTAF